MDGNNGNSSVEEHIRRVGDNPAHSWPPLVFRMMAQVCKLLEDRGVNQSVIETFRKNKMDKKAVWSATNEDLNSLGLLERGHIIAIKGISSPSQIAESNHLRQAIASSAKKRCTNKRKIYQKSVLIGWKHFDEKSETYKSVRQKNGGGTRIELFDNNDNTEVVLDKCKALFFPDGKSTHGNFSSMKVQLGNYKGEVVDNNFTVMSYIEKHKLSKTRLYLLTRKRNLFKELLAKSTLTESSSDEDFEDSTWKEKHTTPGQHGETNTSVMIGTTSERAILVESIQNAYQESLAADQKKQTELEESKEREEQLNNLMTERKNRVEPEPSLSDPHSTVMVRHPILGPKARIFKSNTSFSAVYDWIGSLNKLPQFFQLKDYKGNNIDPSSKIESGSFNLEETEKAIPMSPSGTVAFSGFSTIDSKSKKEKEQEETNLYEELDKLRGTEAEKLSNEFTATVRRDMIYEDFVKLYSKRGTCTSKIMVIFDGEHAYGDGVARDAYSEFFEKLYKCMDGGDEKVTSPHQDEEELETIGKLITHSYISYNVFPLQISKSTLKYYIYGSVSDEELLESFLRYLPEKESDMVRSFQKGADVDPQSIADILSDVGIVTLPSKENIYGLLLNAAKTTLIKNPCFGIQRLVKGLGPFWTRLTPAQLDALYDVTIPTPDTVIDSLFVSENSKQEGRVATWLNRYIRCCSQEELVRFVRFVTGSSVLVPKTVIKVQFVDQSLPYMRPLAETCFKILILARQYPSFKLFTENLNLHIGNPDNWAVHDATL